ncbi:MAG: DHH family phosphoesterase, partial [Senegalia sp. (in: firmicutes)]|uniref:DHH family phosphoesterase n=1 Tax=Senegalia sp. (in: firmicutes) TaxID=1924098 RepID=UPI003F9E9125
MTNNDKKFLKLLNQDENDIKSISKEMNISYLITKILLNRGIKNKEDIEKFLNPTYDDFHDPFLLNDMKLASKRIMEAIELDEKIWIYGDYDVDGVTSTSLLVNFFSQIGIKVQFYIPNRHNEGYGLNKTAIDYIKMQKGNLIITVDCGITSISEADYANEIG